MADIGASVLARLKNKAAETGFYPKDLFILLAKNRLTAD